MTYRKVEEDFYKQRVSELEKENSCLKEKLNCGNKKSIKQNRSTKITFSGKIAACLTIIVIGAFIAARFIGFVRLIALIWSLIMGVFGAFAFALFYAFITVAEPEPLSKKVRFQKTV